MERVDIRIGPVAFDHADYDAENDVLYLHVGEPQGAQGEETPEGHVLRFEPGTQRIVGLTVLGVKRSLIATANCASRFRSRQSQRRRPRARISRCLGRIRVTSAP